MFILHFVMWPSSPAPVLLFKDTLTFVSSLMDILISFALKITCIYLYVCLCVWKHVCHSGHVEFQRTAFKFQVSPSTLWLMRMEFRSSGLARSPFTSETLSKWIPWFFFTVQIPFCQQEKLIVALSPEKIYTSLK